MKIERINPYLVVSDLSTSLKYYLEILGFNLYVETPNLGIVEHDGHQIHLFQIDRDISPHRVWIGIDDVGEYYQTLMVNEAHISQEPQNFSWAYQMIVEDPDGNKLIYGSAPREDLPFLD